MLQEAFDILHKLIHYFEDFKESGVDWINYTREQLGKIKYKNVL